MRDVLMANAKLVPAEAELVFRGVIYDVYQWQQRMFDGSYQTFEMLKRPDTVTIIAVKDDQLVVLEQEQPSYQPFYSFAGGRHDVPEETELAAAQRELREETGMVFATWKLIEITQPTTKIEQFVYTFLTTDFVEQIPQKVDAGEKIAVHLMPFDSVLKLANDSKTRDLAQDVLCSVTSLTELINLPEYRAS